MIEFESKQQVLDVLAPELNPDEAAQRLPVAQAELEECKREYQKAKVASATCKDVVDANAYTSRYLASKAAALTAERDALKANLRTEVYAMHGDCDVEAVSGTLRKKTDSVNFVDEALSFLLEVKAPADTIVYLDALANEAVAEHAELSAKARLSRIRTMVALGPVIESEGEIGVIGAATERLRQAAKAANARIDTARGAARDARLAYERLQSARTSRGIVTSANVSHAIGH